MIKWFIIRIFFLSKNNKKYIKFEIKLIKKMYKILEFFF